MPGPKSAQQDALKESKTSKQRAKEYFMNRFAGVQGRIEAGKKKRKEIQLEKLAEGKLEKTDASLSDEEYIDKQLASATQFGKSEEYLREEARRITKNISIAGQMRLLGKKTGTGRFKKESRVKKFFKNYIFNPLKSLFSKKERPMEKTKYNMEQGYFNPFAAIDQEGNANQNENSQAGEFRQDVETQQNQAMKHDYEAEHYDDASRDWQVLNYMREKRGDISGVSTPTESDLKNQEVNSLQGDIEKYADEYAKNYDSMRAFSPDFMAKEQEDPDNFEVVIAVEPPTDIYGSYNRQFSDEKPTISNIIRKNFGMKEIPVDTKRILEEQMKKSSDYQALVVKGQEEAKKVGMTYDPDVDPNIDILRVQLAEAIANKQGHTFVRMVAKKGEKPMHGYSFGFWPLTTTYAMPGIVNGVVKNPDPDATSANLVERRHPVDYTGYMKAAAKVRGVVGSQRTYSFLGYNCTSFAADVAKEAGVPITDKDSSDDVRTYRFNSQRVDSPYAILNYIKAGANDPKNAEQSGDEIKDMTLREQMDSETLMIFKEALSKIDKEPTGMDDKSKKQREQRGKYLETEDKWLRPMLKNPMFELLYSTYGANGGDEVFGTENSKALVYAKHLIRSIVKDTAHRVEQIENEVEEAQEKFLSEEQQHTGDPITAARKMALEMKRQKMKETFGTDTGTDFIRSVCETPEGLSKAFTLMATKLGEFDFKKAAAFAAPKVKKVEEEPDGENKKKNRNDNISAADKRKEQRIEYLKNNKFYQKRYARLQDVAFGKNIAELLLKNIIDMEKKYVPKFTDEEKKQMDSLPEIVKVQMLVNKQMMAKSHFKGMDFDDYVDWICMDPKGLENAFNNGLKPPITLKKMDQKESVNNMKKRAFVGGGKQQEEITNHMKDCFKQYILIPWYESSEKVREEYENFSDFKAAFTIDYTKIWGFLSEFSNQNWSTRVKMERYLRSPVVDTSKMTKTAKQTKANNTMQFMTDIFSAIIPESEDDEDDGTWVAVPEGHGNKRHLSPDSIKLKWIRQSCQVAGLYSGGA